MTKKIVLRRCVVTNEQHPKNNLIRIVKNNLGEVFVDLQGRQNGRGAYLFASKEVIELAKKRNSLGRSLETTIPEEIYAQLEKIVDGK